ncbi:MAG: S41 family peptidase [Gemmatimonadaceae bacterium]
MTAEYPPPPPPPPRSRAIATLTVMVAALVTGGWLFSQGLQAPTSTGMRRSLVDGVMELVEQRYIDSLSRGELYERAVAGLLEELDDPYTMYLTRDRVARIEERASAQYAGVGLRVDLRDGWPTVTAPIQGSPAHRSGMKSGDRITVIDGKPAKGWTAEETARALRGEPGSQVLVVIERPGVAEPIEYHLTRGEVYRRAISRALMMAGRTGYIDINVFNDSTEHELRPAVDSLLKAGMQSLVLDLRGNPGGVLAQGVAVSELFLDPRQTIVTMRGRTSDMNRTYADTGRQLWPELPLIVLIDSRSASASEIVAGALQDHDRAVIMGTPSFGKGSAQSLFPLPSGAGVRLTTARWYTPAGRSIDKLGITGGTDAGGAVTEAAPADAERPAFKTDKGRVVYGGGGIVPDAHAFDSTFFEQELELSSALGSAVPQFRDALTAHAIEVRRGTRVRSPDFAITPALREEFWTVLQTRRVHLDRQVFDANAEFVTRLMTSEIARIVFGPAVEARRSAERDLVVRQAVGLVAGVRSRDELLARVSPRDAANGSGASARE